MSNSGCFSLWFTPCSQDAIVIQCDINDQQHFSWPGLLKMSARKHQSWSMSWWAQVVCLNVHRHFEIWGLLMSKTLWLWRTFTLQLLCLLHMLLSRVSFFLWHGTHNWVLHPIAILALFFDPSAFEALAKSTGIMLGSGASAGHLQSTGARTCWTSRIGPEWVVGVCV